ncbi:hypothetical protein Esi_0003_0153 [Ectocarpus siliculosus]|uniref:Uncharacterized protein n=1 Tax=Ectocarpus siliculosus TaxID=2880 RepID=D7FW05_ECTSI|nr:hypothetical protein Esi_0003_0153 [Ectocarpus siliculosus]|eukprot:CBJ25525.1 hypothetical protein Esi_0003_0153 [Ectocarpus siliculosus]
MGWGAWCLQVKAPAAATTEHDDRARQRRIAGAWSAPAGSSASAASM